jgi:hypothetical protein
MPSLTRRAPRARVRTLVVSALAALTAALALAPAAPAAVRSNVLINVSGTHNFGALGVYAINGGASITSMQYPTDPCRLAIGSNTCRGLTSRPSPAPPTASTVARSSAPRP